MIAVRHEKIGKAVNFKSLLASDAIFISNTYVAIKIRKGVNEKRLGLEEWI